MAVNGADVNVLPCEAHIESEILSVAFVLALL